MDNPKELTAVSGHGKQLPQSHPSRANLDFYEIRDLAAAKTRTCQPNAV